MESKKNVNYLQKEDFDKFYQKVINVVLDAKSNPGKSNVTAASVALAVANVSKIFDSSIVINSNEI